MAGERARPPEEGYLRGSLRSVVLACEGRRQDVCYTGQTMRYRRGVAAAALSLGGALAGLACSALPDISFVDPADGGASDAGGGDGPLPLDAAADAGLTSARRIRCGSPATAPPYTDSTGQVWSNDVDFDVGMVVSNSDTIAGTSDPTLYHAERYADRTAFPAGFKYTIGGLQDRAYVVKLHFAETSGSNINAPGKRRFNVLINGTQVLTELDIIAESGGGRSRALVKTFPATVKGAPLVVQFTPGSVENPKICAIEVLAGN
jgi:hypothetical protein